MNMSDAEEVRRLVEQLTARAVEPPHTFLTRDEVAALTGRKVRSKQIEALRQMGIPFWVNPVGRAVVTRSAIEGRANAPAPKPAKVVPRLFRTG